MKPNTLLLTGSILALAAGTLQAGSATRVLDPVSNSWNNPTNWMPATVPDSPTDTATFDVSNFRTLNFSASISLSEMIFNPDASAYTFDLGGGRAINFFGAGITNNSGVTQHFSATLFRESPSQIIFHNNATAGVGTVFLVDDPTSPDGMIFYDNSSAGSSTITATGSTGAPGTAISFYDNSTAANAVIVNNGGTGNQGGLTNFLDHSTAADATLTAHGAVVSGATGADIFFFDTARAENATLIADGNLAGEDGGVIGFYATSTGNQARIALMGRGMLYLLGHTSGLSIGSLEGNGQVLLGAINLTVGINGRSTTFGGTILGTTGTPGGSLTKTGTGRLALTRRNVLPGGVTVAGGELIVNNGNGSATGSGLVQVENGILSGRGIIAGTVVVSPGASAGTLSPGSGQPPSALTIKGFLTFHGNSTHIMTFDSNSASANQVNSGQILIETPTILNLVDRGNAVLPSGTVFVVLNNTSALPIIGEFDNLSDGGTIVVNNNTFQADYEGGDGNDLTLTVVP